jgi:hypothetical protein
MSDNIDFNQCVDEVNKLRADFLKISENRDDSVAASVADLAQNQLTNLKSVNDFFVKFLDKSSLKERLEPNSNSILMPGPDSVVDLISATKSGLEIAREVVKLRKCEGLLDKDFIERQKSLLNQFSYSELNNAEFNRSLRQVVQHYKVGNPDQEELGDSTVNTIVSEDVLASSPI